MSLRPAPLPPGGWPAAADNRRCHHRVRDTRRRTTRRETSWIARPGSCCATGAWVFACWALMLLAGGATAGQLSGRLTFDFSLPGQPGTRPRTRSSTARHGRLRRVRPGGHRAAGPDRRAAGGRSTAVFDRDRGRCRACGSSTTRSTGDRAFLTDDGAHGVRAGVHARWRGFRPARSRRRSAPDLTAGRRQAGLEIGVTGYSQLSAGGETEGPSVLAETLIGGRGCAARAGLRVRVVPGASAAAHRGGLDPHDVPGRAGADHVHRRQLRGAVPDLAGRARRGHRLLAAGRLPVARGARPRPRQRGGRAWRRCDGRARGAGLRRHGRDQPDGADRRPGAVPAQHGLSAEC